MLPAVLIFADAGRAHHRGLIRGIVSYAATEARQLWAHRVISMSAGPEHEVLRSPRAHRIAGAICLEGPAMDLLLKAGIPAICTSGIRPDCPVPRIRTDDLAIGARVADYFLTLGLRHFAGVEFERPIFFAEQRLRGFEQALRAKQQSCDAFRAGIYLQPTCEESRAKLAAWLKSLPKPVGILAVNDDLGADILGVCREAGLHVPDDVAVVGVDNDDLVCECALPSLSSVAQHTERIGYESAELLTRLLRGETDVTSRWIEPGNVIVRGSSDVMPFFDPMVCEALKYLRQHFADHIKVENVADHVGVCRKTLDVRFKAALGRTPAGELRRLQVSAAKHLLDNTRLPMASIARASGYSSARQFSESFCQSAGCTPTEFRQQGLPKSASVTGQDAAEKKGGK